PLDIRPVGTIGELLAGQTLSLATCSGEPVDLAEGEHELRLSGALQPFTLMLRSPGTTLAGPPPPGPPVSARPAGSGVSLAVRDARGPFYLVLGQNVAPGWRASVDGASLGPAMVLDGYSAGWRIDRRGSFTVSVDYGPQRRQDLSYVVSGVGLAACIAI